MDKPVKPATQGTQHDAKHNTVCVGHPYAQTNTNNVNKTSALLQDIFALNLLSFISYVYYHNKKFGSHYPI